jgi:uncharacterized coiled-coil protein SlyX
LKQTLEDVSGNLVSTQTSLESAEKSVKEIQEKLLFSEQSNIEKRTTSLILKNPSSKPKKP